MTDKSNMAVNHMINKAIMKENKKKHEDAIKFHSDMLKISEEMSNLSDAPKIKRQKIKQLSDLGLLLPYYRKRIKHFGNFRPVGKINFTRK